MFPESAAQHAPGPEVEPRPSQFLATRIIMHT